MYPSIICSKSKLQHNISYVANIIHRNGGIFAAVSKVFAGNVDLLNLLNAGSCDWIADSRIDNLKILKTSKPKMLIRISQPSECEEVVLYSDISLQSDLSVIRELNRFAVRHHRVHRMLLMLDLGDLREGVFYRNTGKIDEIVAEILKLTNIQFEGLASNLGCFGGIKTTEDKIETMCRLKKHIAERFDIPCPFLSIITTSGFEYLIDGRLPEDINLARIGEAWINGYDTVNHRHYDHLYDDTFIFKGQILEIEDKPSVPIGEIGRDAFGHVLKFNDEGIMRRGILGFGAQDVDIEALFPIDKDITIIGASSDHTIVNLTHARDYHVGDIIAFKMGYMAVMRAFTSHYVLKEIID